MNAFGNSCIVAFFIVRVKTNQNIFQSFSRVEQLENVKAVISANCRMFLLIVIVTAFIGMEIFPEWVQLGRHASVAVKKYILTEIGITLFEDGYPMISWLTTIVSVNYVATR